VPRRRSADGIAAREALVEETIEELAEQVEPPLTPEELVEICRRNRIPCALGAQTCVRVEDYALLMQLAEQEAAFRGAVSE
jgi:hypothetical protein